MTIKEIIRISSGDYFRIRTEEINFIKANLPNMTKYEQAEANKRIKAIAKEIKAALEAE